MDLEYPARVSETHQWPARLIVIPMSGDGECQREKARPHRQQKQQQAMQPPPSRPFALLPRRCPHHAPLSFLSCCTRCNPFCLWPLEPLFPSHFALAPHLWTSSCAPLPPQRSPRQVAHSAHSSFDYFSSASTTAARPCRPHAMYPRYSGPRAPAPRCPTGTHMRRRETCGLGVPCVVRHPCVFPALSKKKKDLT
jgi:hypothetical protein